MMIFLFIPLTCVYEDFKLSRSKKRYEHRLDCLSFVSRATYIIWTLFASCIDVEKKILQHMHMFGICISGSKFWAEKREICSLCTYKANFQRMPIYFTATRYYAGTFVTLGSCTNVAKSMRCLSYKLFFVLRYK